MAVGLIQPCVVGILGFLAQIDVIDLGFQDFVVIAIGSIIAGATAGGGGAILIPTVAPILGAVGIPVSLALVVLATTDNISQRTPVRRPRRQCGAGVQV